MTDPSTVQLLLVEDDSVDVHLVRRALKAKKIANPLRVAKDGVQALEILRGEGGQVKLARPYVILLDLNMPRMNGVEFLAELRKDEEHRAAIVFALTTSRAESDKAAMYLHNIAGYIVKSEVAEGFLKTVDMLDHHWRVVEFPGGRASRGIRASECRPERT